jgi:hypothetical protein
MSSEATLPGLKLWSWHLVPFSYSFSLFFILSIVLKRKGKNNNIEQIELMELLDNEDNIFIKHLALFLAHKTFQISLSIIIIKIIIIYVMIILHIVAI